jgi:hypothetical protein
VYRRDVRGRLDAFVSRPAFEDAAREHARRSVGTDPDYPSRATIGARWGPVPDERSPGTRRTREGEVEIVGYDGKRLALAGEATWSRRREDGAALSQLSRSVIHVPGHDEGRTRLVLYSRDGSTDAFRNRAEGQGVILRTVDGILA